MIYDLVEISDVTFNLDSKRVPLNAQQRKKMESNPIYPYYGANNILGYIDNYIFDEKILCVAEDGGNWGFGEKCSYIVNERCWVNNHAHVLTAKPNLHLEYLCYYLNYTDLSLHITGATRGKLNKGVLNKIKIPLPPLKTQQHIAQILDDAAALRDKTKQLLTEYDLLAQSIFLEMFGDPLANPNKFDRVALDSIVNISSGSTPSRKIESYWEGNIPWVKTGEVNSKLILETEEKITEEGLKNSSCKLYKKGSILIAMYGQGKTRGQVALLGIDATTNQACAVLQPSNKINFTYLYEYLKLSYEDLRSLGRGGNQPNLNAGLIKSYEVMNPPIELQDQFAEKIALIEQQIELAKQELKESEDLFNCLLQKAFNGELM